MEISFTLGFSSVVILTWPGELAQVPLGPEPGIKRGGAGKTLKPRNVWLSWSTGKDAAWTLYQLQQASRYRVTGLFTTVEKDSRRVTMHGTPSDLLKLQADAVNLPLEIVPLPWPCSNNRYDLLMQRLYRKAHDKGVDAFAFGDIHLQDIRAFRTERLEATNISPLFPLWGRAPADLAGEMIKGGLESILTCVDPKSLEPELLGRKFNEKLMSRLNEKVDPCGENGEFHTFAYNGPMFNEAVSVEAGEVVERDGYVFLHLRSRS